MSKLRFLPPALRAPAGRAASRTLTVGRGVRWAISPDVQARHTEQSTVVSALDWERSGDDSRLIGLALRAARRALTIELGEVAARRPELAAMVNTWPGEHYRFLAALAAELAPPVVVEVGTYRGMGALSFLAGLPRSSKVVTFDIVPWRTFPDTLLTASDLAGQGLEQRLGDLSDECFFRSNLDLFGPGSIVFLDAGKAPGIRFEREVTRLLRANVSGPLLLVYDDIRLLTMVEFWRALDLPKFDATSLGHWTGTGLAEVGDWSGDKLSADTKGGPIGLTIKGQPDTEPTTGHSAM